MKNKKKITAVGKILLDVIEIYLPAVMLMVLFACFLIGIIARYVFKNPQSWTFEMSSICYLAVGVLSWGIAHRTDNNVVFDMLYNTVSEKTRCIFRIITNLLMAVVAGLIIWPSIVYVQSMEGLTAQTMPIPRGLIFVPFTISYVAATVRSIYRLVLDVLAFKNGDYIQKYGKEEER